MTKVILQTNFGNITIEVDELNTPHTAQNFLDYVSAGFYDGTIFHRVINNFMIQGGGFTTNMEQKKTRENIKNEADKSPLKNNRGTIAMARAHDPNSASSQFFINVVDNSFLNYRGKTANEWGYCVFGQVTDGMDIVDKIKQAPTTTRQGHQDVPKENIIIEKAFIEEKVS